MDDCHQKSSTSQLHFYKLDVLFQGSHDGVIVVTYVVFLNSLVCCRIGTTTTNSSLTKELLQPQEQLLQKLAISN